MFPFSNETLGLREQNEQEVKMDRKLGWFGASQSNMMAFVASKVLEKCLNQQGIPKNGMLGATGASITPYPMQNRFAEEDYHKEAINC